MHIQIPPAKASCQLHMTGIPLRSEPTGSAASRDDKKLWYLRTTSGIYIHTLLPSHYDRRLEQIFTSNTCRCFSFACLATSFDFQSGCFDFQSGCGTVSDIGRKTRQLDLGACYQGPNQQRTWIQLSIHALISADPLRSHA